ncbi:UDP-N-acetylmuramoyl-L-alanyl-D-glutamate--2,6-diaminopimelate ligase [Actinopolymorpha alba]|uniref:UDP-N-acetylmuramoyl-L-alanyl-D-glutamate--2, 6-diaminopimelate ligase n=1 Tax=Actinopolymorpha alba TaxID=533267 RepID=UPI003B511D96
MADAVTVVKAQPVDDPGDVVVTGVAQDSRRVVPGDLYVARPGGFAHGAAYAQTAARAGAVAALTDPAGVAPCQAAGLPTLVVPNPQAVLGDVSAWVYGYPSRDLLMLGVTGTNGKTTTAYLLDAALRRAGHRSGLVGTVETRIADETIPSSRTTPEAPDLQALFAVMRERGVTAVAMEVSSHALSLGRVDGTVYDVAGFTNFSQDHLELHGTIEAYFAAKAALFTPARARLGVVNVDDPAGRRLAGSADLDLITVSPSGREAADWSATGAGPTPGGGMAFDARGPGGLALRISLGLPGDFNVDNALLAAAMLHAVGIDGDAIVEGFAGAQVPGRMERFESARGFTAIVDYAHTPDAIDRALRAVRGWTKGRVIAVVGCGGDRDHGKRPLMGQAAVRNADLAIITDDNPRSEDPAAIRAAALEGARALPAADRGEVTEVGDRREAIRCALDAARPGDTVLVLGKGHEQGQEVAGVVHPFDDRVVVQEVLQEMSDTIETVEQKGADR